jgi:endonuclease G
MSTGLQGAIDKATLRADRLGENLGQLADEMRDRPPGAVASGSEKRQRRAFLDELHGSPAEARTAFERIIAGNELQDVNYLARGAVAARAVLRIAIGGPGGRTIGYGTGFLVGNGVLMTNNHVLDDAATARVSQAEAFFERSALGEDLVPWRFAFQPEKLFYTSKALDFSLVAVADRDRTGAFPLPSLGWLPLLGEPGKAMEGEWLTIIQHPEGERKEICVRENQLIKRDKDVLWYSTDTLGGSSGSPVFNNDWLVVALHHSGVPEMKNGNWQTVDGRDYDKATDGEDRIKWIANEGIRASRIIETLNTDRSIAGHPLIAPMLATGVQDIDARLPVRFLAGQSLPNLLMPGAPSAVASRGQVGPLAGQSARPVPVRLALSTSPASSQQFQIRESAMPKHITLNLLVDDDGSVSLLQGGATESALIAPENGTTLEKANVISAPVNPVEDWKNAKGYDPKFLGPDKLQVNLPEVTQTELIVPLLERAYDVSLGTEKIRKMGVLNYDGYSVVMNSERRFAFFSAANVGSMNPKISGRTDNWLRDERIDRKYQIDNSYYLHDQFDKGHLTRREDMEWGSDPEKAVRRANGTCAWTNCTPQHKRFNQGRGDEPGLRLWRGLEKYILEQRIRIAGFDAQVITGPIFGAADPVFRDIAYPLEFWKVVVAAVTNGTDAEGKPKKELFATAYLLSQKVIIDKYGLKEAAPVEPFGVYSTYQRPISTIENLTGLKFTYGDLEKKPLSDCDPLKTPQTPARMVRRGASASESFGAGPNDDRLSAFEDIVLY